MGTVTFTQSRSLRGQNLTDQIMDYNLSRDTGGATEFKMRFTDADDRCHKIILTFDHAIHFYGDLNSFSPFIYGGVRDEIGTYARG